MFSKGLLASSCMVTFYSFTQQIDAKSYALKAKKPLVFSGFLGLGFVKINAWFAVLPAIHLLC